MEQGKPERAADPGNGSRHGGRADQAEHVSQPVETEGPTEVALDDAGRQQGLPGIAKGENNRAHNVSITQEIGHDSRDHRPGNDTPARIGPKRDQRSRGDPGGGPEHGHAIGREQGQTHLCGERINAADHDREPERASPSPCRVSRRVDALASHSRIQHVALRIFLRSLKVRLHLPSSGFSLESRVNCSRKQASRRLENRYNSAPAAARAIRNTK